MMYNGHPLKVPACEQPSDHHPQDPKLCTLDAFLKQAKKMTLSDTEYQSECASAINVVPDWD
jgi:hypothetical protein